MAANDVLVTVRNNLVEAAGELEDLNARLVENGVDPALLTEVSGLSDRLKGIVPDAVEEDPDVTLP